MNNQKSQNAAMAELLMMEFHACRYTYNQVMLLERALDLRLINTANEMISKMDSTMQVIGSGPIYNNYIRLKSQVEKNDNHFKKATQSDVVNHLLKEINYN